MVPVLILLLGLLAGEETNPKGFPTPSVRKATLVDMKKTDRAREIDGAETTEKTYLDEKSKERFRTFEVQNNLYRYDLKVKGESAQRTLLDRDGDGRFEVRLPFAEADPKLPRWVLKLVTSPTKLLNGSRLPVVKGARGLQQTAFQRGNSGPPLPVLVLFFVDETTPRLKEAQVHPSVGLALVMERIAKEFEGEIYCVGYRLNPGTRREQALALDDLNRAIGSKMKRVPSFALFTVQKALDRKTGREYHRLKYHQRIGQTVLQREEMTKLQERLSGAIRALFRKLD